jgi:hypothetical protein
MRIKPKNNSKVENYNFGVKSFDNLDLQQIDPWQHVAEDPELFIE